VVLLDEPSPASTHFHRQGGARCKTASHRGDRAALRCSRPPASPTARAFFLQGELVEVGPGRTLFVAPHDKRTED
jgi:hypothetical protein